MKRVMTKAMPLALWAGLVGAVVYGVMVADHAVMFQNPMTTLSLGMIGLGLCMEARKAMARPAARQAD